MSLIHNRSEFADKQVVRLQETPGEQVMQKKRCR
jgi:DNA replicative helicase MCM subunit Mcm2 (Cdc46/Mcm family)